MDRKLILLILVACAVGTYVLTDSGKAVQRPLKNPVSGGETEQLVDTDTETDLSGLESDDAFAVVEQIDNDNEQKQLLELEKQKQELELENQKMKLQQLDVPNTAEIPEVNKTSETSLNGLGSCNEQRNINENNDNLNLLNTNDCNSDYYNLSDDYLSSTNQKIKPNELLPSGAVDMKGDNFLNATLSQSSEQVLGKPTQTHRSRLNYDLRSTPPNPQVEVSPWNMSTMEPDADRRQFEIGTSSNEPNV